MSKIVTGMVSEQFKTAILFLVFNRLDTTKRVFSMIQKIKPPRLYIASDGARKGIVKEKNEVDAVREYITSNINWNCEVMTLFRKNNKGCKYAVSSAIDWFFDNEEMGIILEDDCLPSYSFFLFCEELLIKYKDNQDVYLVSSNGEDGLSEFIKKDYSFTKYALIWGWASWSRVWSQYDVEITDWKVSREKILKEVSDSKDTKKYWRQVFQKVYDSKIDTWDYQLTYLLLKNSGKCIIPKVNLVSNIGFGVNATHTHDQYDTYSNRKVYEMSFPLKHPDNIYLCNDIDTFFDKTLFSSKNIAVRVIKRIYRYANKIIHSVWSR